MAHTECAGHLIDHGCQPAVGLMAIIEADRIEDVAQDPRHGQQTDRPVTDIDVGAHQQGLYLRTQRQARAVAMIPVVKGQKVEAITREQTQPTIQPVDPIVKTTKP